MKNKILLLLLLFTTTFYSQVSDITNLASGKLKNFSQVIDLDSSVFGYLVIYSLEDISETEEKFEYVLLDKNLNKVANGKFIDQIYKRFESKFLFPQKMGDEIIISKVYGYTSVSSSFGESSAKYGFTSHRILSLKNNKMSKSFYYQDEKLIEGVRDNDNIKQITREQKVYDYPITFKGGFFIAKGVKYDSKHYKEINSLKAYNFNREEKWTYDYNIKKDKIKYSFEVLDEENILLRIYNFKTRSISFHSLNPETGRLNFVYQLESKKSDYNHLYNVKAFEDKFVITGKYCDYSTLSGYNQEKAKGYFRIELNKLGEEISKKYLPWKELSSVMKIKKNGKLEEDNFRLSSKRFFCFKNGQMAIVNEKRKESVTMKGVVKVKTTDFVIFHFDENFNIKSKDIIKKDVSKSFWVQTDYLFSQKINDENGAAFFYMDYKKDKENNKNNVLGIVYVKEGKVLEEQIPAKGLEVYKAKEGHVLFREFNKDKNIDEIRLERLNY